MLKHDKSKVWLDNDDNPYVRKDGITYFKNDVDGVMWERVDDDDDPETDPNCRELSGVEATKVIERFMAREQSTKK